MGSDYADKKEPSADDIDQFLMASTFFHVLRMLLAKIPVVLTLCHFWVLSQSPLKG